jgi:vancomycin resistance protein YoaR
LDIESAILTNKKRLGESSDFVKIKLVTRPIQPEITIEKINNLGIKELLGKGTSYFTGSPTSRIHNIILASSRLNGLLIKPEEAFSFNQALGDISQATGYQQAYIIKEGETILDDGGGVCQVSTTLFRAALNLGLPILERYPHSYRVSYYEQGGFGPGLDATVFYPTVDLKFKNDTLAHILIQAYTDMATNTLTFELYGTSDGRKTTLSKPVIWEQIEPPEDLYQDEPNLPQGVVKRIERKAWGAKVSVHWQIECDGEVINQKDIFSFYNPWQAVYLRGTGEF